MDSIVYLPFVHCSITACVFLLYMFVLFISLCSECIQNNIVLSADCYTVTPCLQDDGDVEDDMTIREVRQTVTQQIHKRTHLINYNTAAKDHKLLEMRLEVLQLIRRPCIQ